MSSPAERGNAAVRSEQGSLSLRSEMRLPKLLPRREQQGGELAPMDVLPHSDRAMQEPEQEVRSTLHSIPHCSCQIPL